MTAKMAKPKPRKKAAKPAASFEAAPNDLSSVYKLIARYRFLEAEQGFQSAAATTAQESDRLGSGAFPAKSKRSGKGSLRSCPRHSATPTIYCSLQFAKPGKTEV
jgi:hypothetical protein